MALRYFAGGSIYDIGLVHGVQPWEVYRSAWRVVDTVNLTVSLQIAYPEDHATQKQIASGFLAMSGAGFDCCAGAIDGVLVWIEESTASDCALSNCGPKKFFCGRKHKFGLNMQAVCDADC